MPLTSPVVSLRGVSKRFGKTLALDDVNLCIMPEEIVGLIGLNGAGKTTLVNIIEGLFSPDSGDVALCGLQWKDAAETLRHKIGVCTQETVFAPRLTVGETLCLFGSFHGASTVHCQALLDRLNMREMEQRRVAHLSGGNRRKLALAIALVGEPELMILDEPTTGLDPLARREIWDLLKEQRRLGTTIILTSHHMEEAEQLCSRIVVIDCGKVLAQGSVPELLSRFGNQLGVDGSLEDIFTGIASEARRPFPTVR